MFIGMEKNETKYLVSQITLSHTVRKLCEMRDAFSDIQPPPDIHTANTVTAGEQFIIPPLIYMYGEVY